MYHSLSTDHIPWLFQVPYTTVCPKNACHSLSKDQILQLVQRPNTTACPQATYHGLSKDHIPWLVQRPHTMACPQATFHGLSKDHIPTGLVQRPHTNRVCPKTTYQWGLSKECIPWLIQRLPTNHRPPSMGSPEARYQGLSICYPQRLVNRPSTEASSPQTMYQSINKRQTHRFKRKFYNFTPYNNLWSKKLVYWVLRMKKNS